MADIVQFTGTTYLDQPPDGVLEAAMGKLNMVLVIGVEGEPHEPIYFAGSTSDVGAVLLLLERAKQFLLRQYP